jgi:hypothetical protein
MLKNIKVDVICISYHMAKKNVKSGKKMKEEVK